MNNAKRFQYLIRRYLDNTCTHEELEEFFKYVNSPDNDVLLDQMLREVWDGEPSRMRDNIPSMVADGNGESIPMHRRRRTWWGVAASLSALVAVALVFYLGSETDTPEIASAQATTLTSKSTQEERRLITLPDGSSVWLNSDSKLDYPTSFPDDKREVKLTGEAFFDIQSQEGRPFTIYSGQIKTTVLGTAFNIRAFPEEKSVTVTVARGKVLVRDQEDHENILVANQQISIVPDESKSLHQNAKADSVSNWIHQDLVLDNITFEEAAKIIEDRYGVAVSFRDENLKRCRFTSTFLHEASLSQMLTAICIVNRATFQIEGQQVSINGEGCEERK